MDGISGAASLIAVIEVSAKIVSLCAEYSIAVKDAKKDIERLQRKVADFKEVLGEVKQLLDGRDKTRLSATLKDCFLRLEELNKLLDPGKTHKAMSRLGVRALKWPFTSREVERIVVDMERYEQTFILALQVDQTDILLKVDQKIELAKLPIAKGAFFDSHMEEHNARCLENTRVDLLRQIREWAKDENGKSVFWLNGMAGTGKSTIARTVARSLAENNQLGASFFFKKGEGDRGNAARFFTTIATDLIFHLPELIPCVKKAIDTDPAISEKALKDQFEKLILQPLLQIKQESFQALEIVVVIDALDECDREEDIRAILQLLARAKDVKPVSLRVFLTSRPELPIRLGFKQMSDGTYQNMILHQVPQQTIEQDIALFLEHELGMIRELRSLSPSWPGKDSIQVLVKMAIPLFIFAATVCRYIGDKRDNPKKRLEIILQYQTAPEVSKLDRTYLPILNQLFEEDELDRERQISEFREIVGSIVVLESPLSIVSLAHLLDIPKEDISCRLDLLHSVLSISDEDTPVRLLHLSFRDFLLDPQKRGKSPFWVDERETHEKLASKCLQLMSGPNGLRQNMCNLSRSGTLRSEIDKQTIDCCLQSEVWYACLYWVYHLQQSKNFIRDSDSVHNFLQHYLLYWLEAMSLIRKASESIRMINSLKSLIDSDKNPQVLAFVHDAKRFALRNQSILEDAPLQLYSSALIFAPEMSIIQNKFNGHISKGLIRLSRVESSWNASLQTLEGHSQPVWAVAFSPDGQIIASGSKDFTVRLWDAKTGSCHSTLKGHSAAVNAVVFSPDNRTIASGSADSTIRLWDAATGSCLCTLKGPLHTVKGFSNIVKTLVFSPNGQFIASGSSDSMVRLWDTATGSCRSMLEGHSGSIIVVAFSPDGQLLACLPYYDSPYCDSTVRLWNTASGSLYTKLEGHSDFIRAVAFSPDCQLIASGSNDSTVRLWDAATGSCLRTLEGHFGNVKAVVFLPDGQFLASGSDDSTIRLWDVATGSCRSTFRGHSGHVRAVAFSPNSQLIASGSADSTVRLWEATMGSCLNTIECHSSDVKAVAFSPNSQLVVSGSNDSTVRLWDVATGTCLCTLQGHSNCVSAVAFSPNSQLVVSGSNDSTVRLWDTATGSCCSTLEGHHSAAVNAVAFSPDNIMVASGSADSTIRLWDAATGSCLCTLKGHLDRVKAVVFSPDGQLLASGSSDFTVRLWETATRSCRSTLEGHSRSVLAVAFSPHSPLVASGSTDCTVRLWDTTTGSCCSILDPLFHDIRNIAFSSDGSHLITDKEQIFLHPSLFKIPSHPKKQLRSFFVNDQWISSAEQRLLWLPTEYRPTCTAVRGDFICLGHASGQITILKFDFESNPP